MPHPILNFVTVTVAFRHRQAWDTVDLQPGDEAYHGQHESGLQVQLRLEEAEGFWTYELSYRSPWPTRVRMTLRPIEKASDVFHLIPANIHGDNNLAHAEPGHYPNLTNQPHESPFASPYWEFRADRAPYPFSALCFDDRVFAVSVDPYSACPEHHSGHIANGLFAELPDAFGITLGFGNDPATFIEKEKAGPPVANLAATASCTGRIYLRQGDRRTVHGICRDEYELRAEPPIPKRSHREAAEALCHAFVDTNYSQEMDAYTNMTLKLEGDTFLRPWRPLIEIGWTGGGPLAYPLIRAERQLRLGETFFTRALPGGRILDRIAASRNPESGFFYDLTEPWIVGQPPGNHVNGWWTGYPLCRDVHGAYTNGSAVYYLLKSVADSRAHGEVFPDAWLDSALSVLATARSLQRADGNFGFSYRIDRPEVHDWDGFAGCWFAAASALAGQITGDKAHIEAARKAMNFYRPFVRALNCWGTPMDTWKSVDEEGNLAFIKAARHLHEITGETCFLEDWIDGAHYELIWRYAYRTRPPAAPLRDTEWNSCGGSITSVSNPHAHPMALIATGDFLRLAEVTGDSYWKRRAGDSVHWIEQCMELYPEHSGYGHYGVLTERFCPSDGLLTETFDDGSPASLWFTYNGWAAAAALEGILEWMEHSP